MRQSDAQVVYGGRMARLFGWLLAGVMVCLVARPMSAEAPGTAPVARLFASRASAQPTGSHGPGVLVTLVVQDSTVEYVVNALTRQAQLKPLFNKSAALSRRITVRVTKTNVMDALGIVLRGTGLEATLLSDGETVAIHPRSRSTATEQARVAGGIIAGRVTDSTTGAGLNGASIRVVGTKIAAVSTDSGQFTLKGVPAGDQVLLVRLFGYRPATRTITVVDSERTTVYIVMTPVPTVLSGVVTTATGQQARYQVGNDITVLNADSILKIAPVSNLTDMLETRVPGLIVQHTSGIPGAPSRLRLRGVSSINESADPILIVDGIRVYADQSGNTNPQNYQNNGNIFNISSGGGSKVGNFAGPSALDQLDPNSIETIEVLKGPSATAIYGSDAANGVIVITTKRGRVGPTHWSVALDQGRTTLPGSWPTNYYLFCHDVGGLPTLHEPLDCKDPTATLVKDSLVAFQALNDLRYSPLTGHAGQNRDGSLTVSGGSGALTYSVTGTASTQSGYLHLPPIELQRFQEFHGFSAPSWMRTPDQYVTYGENSQLTVQVSKGGGTLSLSDAIWRSAQQQSSLQTNLAQLSQTYVDTTQLGAHPIFSDYYTRAQLRTTTFTNAVTLSNWAPWHVLPVTATAGLNVQNQDNNTLTPRDYILGTDDSLGQYQLSQGSNSTFTLNLGTTLSQRLVNTALGINVNTVAQSNFAAATTGLPIGVTIPSSFAYTNGTGPSYNTANTSTYGWYVQPTFNFGNRFFASPGFRLDGGSNSGTRGGVTGGGSGGVLSLFPKLDFSWLALNRSPSNPLFGLTLLRPRIAFGIAGVEPGPGQQLSLLQPAQVAPIATTSGAPADILQLQTLGNPKLVPERDREIEGGFDAQFWNQRLTMTLTGYHKRAYDAILSIPIAPSVLGTWTQNSEAVNIGTIQNTGTEATVFARLLDSRLVDWSANASVSKNSNKLISLVAGQPPITVAGQYAGFTSRITPGYPLFGWWARPIVGYTDANHDGLIEPSEVRVGDSAVYVGAQMPNYELTVSTDLRFFNDRLTINTSIDYQNGLTQNRTNGDQYPLSNPNLSSGEQAALSALSEGTGIGLLQTVNTLRWQTLSIGYLVPPKFARFFRVPTLSVSLIGSNLGLHTNYRGKDPNANAFTNGNSTQDNGNVLPQPHVWNLRVTIGH